MSKRTNSKLDATIKLLRQFIFEEVDRAVRRSAGFSGGAGLAGRQHDGGELPPLGLGDKKGEQEREYGKEQEKSQFAARVSNRKL